MMRVSTVSTHDTSGGASVAAFRLHRGLLENGVESKLFCRWNHSKSKNVVGLYDKSPWFSRLMVSAYSFWLRLPLRNYQIGKNCDVFSLPFGPCKELPNEFWETDLLHLHWVSSMIDIPSFLTKIPTEMKVIWTLHDMNLMTGGCHYTGPCQKYMTVCNACPELNSEQANDLSNRSFNIKEKVFREISDEKLTIVCPSDWLATCAKKSTLLRRFPIRVIPYGVDTSVFQPTDRSSFRKAHQVQAEEKVVLFVSNSLGNYRKGLDLLLASLQHLDCDQRIVLFCVGKNNHQLAEKIPDHIRLVDLGYLTDPKKLSEAYSASDVFVIPSRQDNLPNTVLESLACGTPVAGFNVGGIPEMVVDGKCGFLAEPENPHSLADAIRNVFLFGNEMRTTCRSRAVSNYASEYQARSYKQLYREMLNEVD